MVKLFLSYAHKDGTFKERLLTYLKGLERTCNINVWADNEILPGTEWHPEIFNNLRSSQVILLLISPDFLASDFCYLKEMKEAIEMHKNKQALVIPVMLQPVNDSNQPFSSIQTLPSNPRYVADWPSVDKACVDIIQGIEKAVDILIHDIITYRQKEVEQLIMDSNLLEACNRVMDFATDFSASQVLHRRKAMSIKATWSFMMKKGEDDPENINKIMMMILELLDEIALPGLFEAA